MASKAETVRRVKAMWREEVDGEISTATADAILDRMCEGFFHRWVGFEHEDRLRLVVDEALVAEYLMWQWQGDDGRALRAVIAEAKEKIEGR